MKLPGTVRRRKGEDDFAAVPEALRRQMVPGNLVVVSGGDRGTTRVYDFEGRPLRNVTAVEWRCSADRKQTPLAEVVVYIKNVPLVAVGKIVAEVELKEENRGESEP